jgi:putative membrane protein
MKKLIFSLFFISFAVLAQDMQNRQNQQLDEEDFIVKAASGGMMEVELGKLAQEKGKSQLVKNFGERMERDHSKANDELKNIAQRKNIQLPDSMLEKHREHVDELSQLSAEEFDKAYMELMVEDHNEDLELFEEASEEYEVSEIKQWAGKTLQVLREHRTMAETVHEQIQTKDSE